VDLLRRIRERKIVQWAVVYLAGGWLGLEALGFVADTFVWPVAVVRSAILILAVGFLAVLVLAWYHGEKGHQRLGGVELLLLAGLAVIGAVLVAVKGRAPDAPIERPIETSLPADAGLPAVAVVPFSVRGADMEVWSEGLVDLLSINLDGSALRAIDSRTVLARWHERTASGREADLETALAVARATGARHVVLGTAVTTGTQVRLAANVRELEAGELVHQAHVDGQVDSMIVLVDRLSIELLRFLLQELEGEPRANLASITTASLDALKSFLNGEQLYRRGEYGEADQAYTRAVGADSTFALALYRLGLTRGWTEAAGTELAEGPLARAISLGNLPQRELGLARAALAVVRGDETEIDSARVLASRYPDDAEAWYVLGELFYHEGMSRQVGWEETEAALERAVDLDPSWAPHFIHLVDLAFVYHADSSIAADRMAHYRQLAPASDWNRLFDMQFDLAFADSAAGSAAMAELAAGDLIEVRRVRDRMTHPRFWNVQEQILLMLLGRESGSEAASVFRYLVQGNLYVAGRLSAALGYMDDSFTSEALGLCDIAAMEKTVDLDSRPFERWFASDSLGSAAADPGDVEALLMDAACRSMYAAYRGWEDQQSEHRGRLGEIAAALSAEDSSAAVIMEEVLRLVDGLTAWLGGDAQGAYDLLIEFTPQPDLELPRTWWAQILIEVDRPDEAIPYLVGQRSDPLSHLNLGRAYEALGRDAEARDAYEFFLTYWADADPELQWLVEEARQGLMRIAARLN